LEALKITLKIHHIQLNTQHLQPIIIHLLVKHITQMVHRVLLHLVIIILVRARLRLIQIIHKYLVQQLLNRVTMTILIHRSIRHILIWTKILIIIISLMVNQIKAIHHKIKAIFLKIKHIHLKIKAIHLKIKQTLKIIKDFSVYRNQWIRTQTISKCY